MTQSSKELQVQTNIGVRSIDNCRLPMTKWMCVNRMREELFRHHDHLQQKDTSEFEWVNIEYEKLQLQRASQTSVSAILRRLSRKRAMQRAANAQVGVPAMPMVSACVANSAILATSFQRPHAINRTAPSNVCGTLSAVGNGRCGSSETRKNSLTLAAASEHAKTHDQARK